MPTLPVDLVNRALDECGFDEYDVGDLSEGTDAAMAALRIYDPTLRQLLSAAHWNFARKQEKLVMIGDVTGINAAFTGVPGPWSYMYEWPTDCVHARFVPRTDQTVVGNILTWASPAPFLVASFSIPNPIESQWDQIEGHDPEQTRVILTNQLTASLVYTGMMMYPDAWDPLFEQAMVAVLAARLAMAVIKDKREARIVRADNISIAKGALDAARVRDGDEGWTIADHTPDWIRARTAGAAWSGPGTLWMPWASMPFVEDAGGTY